MKNAAYAERLTLSSCLQSACCSLHASSTVLISVLLPYTETTVYALIYSTLMAGNARIAGFEKDLGMAGTDYNATLSLFFVSYIVFEIPCNILCKIIGPGWFLPA